MKRKYHGFGLKIESEIELPMLEAEFDKADVSIEQGHVPPSLQDPLLTQLRYQCSDHEFLLEIDEIARYLASDGRKIVVEPAANIGDADLQLFLLGSVFGALLQQRSVLTLHASAVAARGKAVLFLGRSGNGKSTIAAALRKRGYQGITDDLCPIQTDKNAFEATPTYPNSKLWPDSLSELSIESRKLPRVRPKIEKRNLDWTPQFADQPISISHLFLLAPSATAQSVSLNPLAPSESLLMLREHTYRRQYFRGIAFEKLHFKLIAALANQLPVIQLLRPEQGFALGPMIEHIEEAIS